MEEKMGNIEKGWSPRSSSRAEHRLIKERRRLNKGARAKAEKLSWEVPASRIRQETSSLKLEVPTAEENDFLREIQEIDKLAKEGKLKPGEDLVPIFSPRVKAAMALALGLGGTGCTGPLMGALDRLINPPAIVQEVSAREELTIEVSQAQIPPEVVVSPEAGTKILRCDISVIEDSDPKYDINIEEVRRILEDNNVECPYMLDIKLQLNPAYKETLPNGEILIAPESHDAFDLGILKWHTIKVDTADEISSTVAWVEGHDSSILDSLEGVYERRWFVVHGLGHMILEEKGLPHEGPEAELWCDRFADENYQKYQVVVEQK